MHTLIRTIQNLLNTNCNSYQQKEKNKFIKQYGERNKSFVISQIITAADSYLYLWYIVDHIIDYNRSDVKLIE